MTHPGTPGPPDDTAYPCAGDTMAEAARKIVAFHLGRLRFCDPGTRVGTDPEALHNMRVAVRRMRAALRVFKAAIPARSRVALECELKWLGQCLGRVRDLDVQLGEFRQYGVDAPPDQQAALKELAKYLRTERVGRRREMLAALDSRRYRQLLTRSEGFGAARAARPRTGPGAVPLAVAGRRAVERVARRLFTQGDAIDAHAAGPSVDDLHALRIRAKRLRYLLEFLRELTGKPGRRLVQRTIRLQDLLGAHQDAVVAEALIRAYVAGPGAASSREHLLALGAVINHQQGRAAEMRAAFHKTWLRFAKRHGPRALRDLLQRLRQPSHEAASSAPAGARPVVP